MPQLLENLRLYEVATGTRPITDLANPIRKNVGTVSRPSHPPEDPPMSASITSQEENDDKEATDFFGLSKVQKKSHYNFYDAYEDSLSEDGSILQDTQVSLPVYPHDYFPQPKPVTNSFNDGLEDLLHEITCSIPRSTESKKRKKECDQEGLDEDSNYPTEKKQRNARDTDIKSGTRASLIYPENKRQSYNYLNNHWVKPNSSLSCTKCWKCGKTGHMSDDCTKYLNVPVPSSNLFGQSLPDHVISSRHEGTSFKDSKGKDTIYSPILRKLYNKCLGILKNRDQHRCSTCAGQEKMAYCLDCDNVFCDSGHLASHLYQNLTHNQIVSFKIGRLVFSLFPKFFFSPSHVDGH
eukprot:TRINITY_DN11164_c0_g1_i2.p1 TRINITY_DN11164_c0_g1~~TRINITY_DN11164_c0_g1_i2.p1  ORF type:complete len:386 (-),score=68.73 TRINITY_DN11164_c0_g1_i2:395-1447(-)